MTQETLAKVVVLAVSGLMLTAPNSALAEAPALIPLQGLLTDAEGYPIVGEKKVLFSLYTEPGAQNPAWSENRKLNFVNGELTIYLGEETPLPLELFAATGEVWLGIKVANDPEMNRILLGTAPYAAYAEVCGLAPAHTHSFAELEGQLEPAMLPAGITMGGQSCPAGQLVGGLSSDGKLQCQVDSDTTYTGSNFALSNQQCPAGKVAAAIGPGGKLECVDALPGSTYSGKDFALSGQGCGGTQFVKAIDADGKVQCGSDANTTYGGSDFAISNQSCPAGQFASAVGPAGQLQCTAPPAPPAISTKMLYLRSAGCGTEVIPTTEATCKTIVCDSEWMTIYYNCSKACNSFNMPQTCNNTPLGYLIAP